MRKMGVGNGKWILCLSAIMVICGFSVVAAHGHSNAHNHGGCSHAHHHHEEDHHHHHHPEVQHHHVHRDDVVAKRRLLPEELAEEEDLKSHGFQSGGGDHHHHQDNTELSGLGLWMHAMGCSLLVSLASLICLIILPLILLHGKPSKAVVDSLALFGAGAMLGDAFLHQLPHAFGGEHAHVHDHHSEHQHSHGGNELLSSHSHSLKDLSVGLSILAGIVLFLLVEKLVRYVEGSSSGGVDTWGHGHHHHKHSKKSITDNDKDDEDLQEPAQDEKNGSPSGNSNDNEKLEEFSATNASSNGEKSPKNSVLRKRITNDTHTAENDVDGTSAPDVPADKSRKTLKQPSESAPSRLVFGYLNLFSDGVHNFTDGMALGSAFLLYGSIGGWSRTLFLLAHELPQEIGDFGILVRSGFSVPKALFFNLLSALVALVGTAMALMMGQNPGQSSLIEGFTAGGFIYISVAGVLAEMNSESLTLKSSAIQLLSLLMGMATALCISLIE